MEEASKQQACKSQVISLFSWCQAVKTSNLRAKGDPKARRGYFQVFPGQLSLKDDA